jgi:hypothetical protein
VEKRKGEKVDSVSQETKSIKKETIKKMEKDFKINGIYSWSEVSEIHQTRHGIYQRKGELISLLTDFGQINPCYPDFTSENANEIFYTGAGRRGDQKLDVWNQAMNNAIKTQMPVPLFCKLKVGQWKFLGFWQIKEANYIFEEINRRMIWRYVLKKIDSARV